MRRQNALKKSKKHNDFRLQILSMKVTCDAGSVGSIIYTHDEQDGARAQPGLRGRTHGAGFQLKQVEAVFLSLHVFLQDPG